MLAVTAVVPTVTVLVPSTQSRKEAGMYVPPSTLTTVPVVPLQTILTGSPSEILTGSNVVSLAETPMQSTDTSIAAIRSRESIFLDVFMICSPFIFFFLCASAARKCGRAVHACDLALPPHEWPQRDFSQHVVSRVGNRRRRETPRVGAICLRLAPLTTKGLFTPQIQYRFLRSRPPRRRPRLLPVGALVSSRRFAGAVCSFAVAIQLSARIALLRRAKAR